MEFPYNANIKLNLFKMQLKKYSLRTGFEPAREYPNGFQVHRLNHSAIAADMSLYLSI